jgi:hypothetical protein
VTRGWDVWSFGITAHEVLAGCYPLRASAEGKSELEWMEEYRQLCRGAASPCLQLQGHTLEALVLRTLRPDPRERPTAAELMQSVAEALGTAAPPGASGSRTAALPVVSTTPDLQRPKPGARSRRLRWTGVAAAAALVAVLVTAGVAGYRLGTRPVADPESFFQRSYPLAEGEWLIPRINERFPGPVLATDLDGQAGAEFVALVNGQTSDAKTARVVVLAADGQVRWEHRMGRELQLADDRYANTFSPATAEALRLAGGRPGLAVVATHNPWWPAQLLVLDGASGQPIVEYLHAGHLSALAAADLDGDGVDEVIAGGTNNRLEAPKRGLGVATLAVLGTHPFRGRSPGMPQPAGLDFPLGQEEAFVRFPLSDVGLEHLQVRHAIQHVAVRRSSQAGDLIEAGSRETGGLTTAATIRSGLVYWFDAGSLLARGVSSDDGFGVIHQELVREGRLRSRLDEGYFQALEAGIRYWDGQGWLSAEELRQRLAAGTSGAKPSAP